MGFNLIWLTGQQRQLARELDAMLPALAPASGHRPPLVGRTFPFAALPEALAHLQSGTSTGKVVVLCGEDDHPI